MSSEDRPRRLSWIEITLVVIVVLIVIALVLPALHASREAARRQQSRNNLKDFGLALHSYHDSFQLLPPGGTFREDGKPIQSWTFFLNGYLAQVAPYFVIDHNLPWDDPVNWSPMSQAQYLWINGYLDPSVPTSKTPEGCFQVHYAPNEWLMYRNSSVRMSQIPDQTGTLLMADAFGDFAIFGDPINWRDPTVPFRSSSTGFGHIARRDMTLVLFVDGRVDAMISKKIAPQVLRAMTGPEDLRPAAEKIARRDKPYQPLTEPVWTYLIRLRGHKGLLKFSLSPDHRQLIANFGNDGDFEYLIERDDLEAFVKGASITHIDIKGQYAPEELRLLLSLPTVKTISLNGNAPLSPVADVLKEFPQVWVVDDDAGESKAETIVE